MSSSTDIASTEQIQAAERADRRRLKRSVLILTLSLVSVGVLLVSSVLTDTASVTDNTFSTGNVDIAVSPTSALLTMNNMTPGDQVTAPLTVSNDGAIQLRYATTSTTTENTLAAQLVMTIKAGVTTCTNAGFGGSGTTIYQGPLGSTAGTNVIGNPAQGAQAGDRVLNAGASEVLCFNVTLPADTGDGFAGLSTTATYTFHAEQTANNP
jgi:hypothetical protein